MTRARQVSAILFLNLQRKMFLQKKQTEYFACRYFQFIVLCTCMDQGRREGDINLPAFVRRVWCRKNLGCKTKEWPLIQGRFLCRAMRHHMELTRRTQHTKKDKDKSTCSVGMLLWVCFQVQSIVSRSTLNEMERRQMSKIRKKTAPHLSSNANGVFGQNKDTIGNGIFNGSAFTVFECTPINSQLN